MEQSTSESVNAGLAEIMRDDMNVDVRRITPESRLIDDVGLDSVAFAVSMVAIEDRYGVALSEEDLLSCDTVADLLPTFPRRGLCTFGRGGRDRGCANRGGA